MGSEDGILAAVRGRAPARRLSVVSTPLSGGEGSFSDAVRQGLGGEPKSLPCRFFYDTRGSMLFEEICRQPEYYPTRTEERILAREAVRLVEAVAVPGGPDAALAELGSGSSRKTRLLIEELLSRQMHLRYSPIDISASFLEESARALLERYPRLSVDAIAGEYCDALPHLSPHAGPRLLLVLGGNIGNFEEGEASALLARAASALGEGGRLLVGFDRLKDPAFIERAYDDEAGVTEAFNKNLLLRINRELGGAFDPDAFAHAAPFVAGRSRIEMHLVSRCRQSVRVEALGRSFRFEAGETIHTENSHKYDVAGFERLCRGAGLHVLRLLSDPLEWFSVALLGPDRPKETGV